VKTYDVGYLTEKTKKECTICQTSTRHDLVIAQKLLKIGPLIIMGMGDRNLKWKCYECGSYQDISDTFRRKTKKMKYYTERGSADKVESVSLTKRISFPMMTEKRRESIVKDNRKEGVMTTIFGIILALIVGYFSVLIGWLVALVSIMGGFYLAFEEPAKKHEAIIIKHGYQKHV
jgi:hypothetical protein